MSQTYAHEVSTGILSRNQADVLIELKTLLDNLEQVSPFEPIYPIMR